MSYLDSGYNEFLENTTISQPTEYSDLDTSVIFGNLGGEKILSSGSISSESKKLNLDLGEDLFFVNDGTTNRVEMGKFNDGEYGLRIYDRAGNILFDITGSNNIIQSSDKSMQLDLSDRQLRVYEGNVMRILIGYQQGGF